EVVFLERHRHAPRTALVRGNIGVLPIYVELLAVNPRRLAGAVVVVDADGQPVHPGLPGPRLCAALADREAGEPAVGAEVELRPQRVETGGLQPQLPPAGQIPSGRLL